jgi:hypothetical protein
VGIQLKFDSVYASWDNLKPSVLSAARQGEGTTGAGDKGITVTVCRRRESAATGVLSRGEQGR